MPFCEMRLGGRPVMFSPLNRMRPEVGRMTPVRQLKNVLLPAPLGPMMARISPRPDLEIDAVERGEAAEAHGQRLGAQDGARLPDRRWPRRAVGEKDRLSRKRNLRPAVFLVGAPRPARPGAL